MKGGGERRINQRHGVEAEDGEEHSFPSYTNTTLTSANTKREDNIITFSMVTDQGLFFMVQNSYDPISVKALKEYFGFKTQNKLS